MSQSIVVRLRGYGDSGVMREVAEIVLPEGFSTVKALKVTTVPGKPHLMDRVDIEFEKGSVG